MKPTTPEEILTYNRRAWDREVTRNNRWTIPVGTDAIDAARQGRVEIVLTPSKTVPADWFPSLAGARVLALASGGGQQGPLLAAAGGRVTVLDNSPLQLKQDRAVAARERLTLGTVRGDMADLSMFPPDIFDLIVHPCSNCFAPSILPVWRECFRVLAPGGALLSGFTNPVVYLFDPELEEQGILKVKNSIPYSSLDAGKDTAPTGEPLEFGHTLDDQIGGQLQAGFVLAGFYEDRYPGAELDRLIPTFIATRAVKPG